MTAPLLQKFLLVGLLFFITIAVLNPNPFGNNPDIIGDESYFLTSALSGLQKMTPPGLIFTAAGNYYGGPQTYLDTIVLVPVIGSIFIKNHFSLETTSALVALHTGDLLGLLRFVNGLCVVLFCAFLFLYMYKRRIPRDLALQLLLLVFLVFSNALVAQFIHTAKVWTLYMLFDVGIGVLFITNEYYLAKRGESFVSKKIYVALFVWAGILAFFQNYVGVFPIVLWTCYALVLKHMRISDIFSYLWQRWYLIAAFSILQLSFIYRAIFVKTHVNWWDPGIVSTTVGNTETVIDWFHRLVNPLVFAVGGQPLVLLYVVGCIGAFIYFFKKTAVADTRARLYLLIACAHPVFVYIIFHVLLGFSLFPRYSLPLTIAFSLAIVMLSRGNKWLLRAGLLFAGILFIIVSSKSILLYWQPSSDVVLTQIITEKLDSPETVFIIQPDAWRFSLPLTNASLELLVPRRKLMSRYVFLKEHEEMVQSFVTFKSTVLTADTETEAIADLARFATSSKSIWTISTSCTSICTPSEANEGTCFAINLTACGQVPQEINMLTEYLSFTQQGTSYVMRKVP